MLPDLTLYNHQNAFPFDEEVWQKLIVAALPLCLEARLSDDAPLVDLQEVEFCFLDDPAIAKIHGEFMSDPTPTDVITFHHGEIHVSLETAHRQANQLGLSYDKEVVLYMIHGLLHLAGWVDYTPEDRERMHARQDRILEQVWTAFH